MTISWPFSRQQVFDASGRPYISPRAFFFEPSSTDALTVYADALLSAPLPQPVVADGFGRFPRVYMRPGVYREEMHAPDGSLLWNDDAVGEPVSESTIDPSTPIDANRLLSTGDTMWRMDAAIRPGWVRMNERTIGNLSSGATELADATASAAFVYLWQNFGDAIAPVIGGRGISAASDFAAGKQIVVPSMRGIVAAGLDDMGSTPANMIQVSVNLDMVAGQTQASVADGSRLAIGMAINAPGVPANTLVHGINGNVITMSNPAGAGSTGTVIGRFSIFPDAQVPGALGGKLSEKLITDQLPTFTPSGTISDALDHQHDVEYQRPVSGYGTGGIGGVSEMGSEHTPDHTTKTKPAGAHGHTFEGNQIGNGAAHSNVQPTRLGTWYLKL